MTAPPAAWQLAPGLQLHIRTWEGEHALYNNLTGDTHLLGAPAIHILDALRHNAASPAELQAQLAQALGLDAAEPGLDEELDSLLASLHSLHLIEPA